MTARPGVFTVTLDFELFWGIRQSEPLDKARARLIGGRDAVRPILTLFKRFEVHATWATVGALMCDSRERALALAPSHARADVALTGEDERSDPWHFAPSLVAEIGATPNQEIATHTFSHLCCLETQDAAAKLTAELQASQRAASAHRAQLTSLVFPRNELTPALVSAAGAAGMRAYRGNPRSGLYNPDPRTARLPWRRALRLLDAYLPISGLNGHPLRPSRTPGPVNVPASRFLRPVSRTLRVAEPLRLARILIEMTHAARRGCLYHLWFHEHNFGELRQENMRFLERLLTGFSALRKRYGMRSLTMGEVARELVSEQQ